MAKEKTISLWHIDGIAYEEGTDKEVGRVYRNGTLANTKGKWEMVTITY